MTRVAIDIGQTGIRLRVDDDAPVEMASDGVGGGTVEMLLPAIRDLRDRAGAGGRAALAPAAGGAVGVGVTGDYADADARRLTRGIATLFRAPDVRVVHDSVTTFLGALGPRPGVVTMCGTGAVTLGFDGRRLRRFDALGALGDWGGGSALGLAGVRAALRAWDGVGPPTALADAASAAWASPAELHSLWRAGDTAARAFVSAFARVVAACAGQGDAVAALLVSTAAHDAAQTTCAALRAVERASGPAGSSLASYGGAMLLRVDGFRAAWLRSLEEAAPQARVLAPDGDALLGAVRLLELGSAECGMWGVVTAGGDHEPPAPVRAA